MNKRFVTLAAACAVFSGALPFAATPALATTVGPASITVSANVQANCTITAGNVNFSTYDPVVTNSSSGADLSKTFSNDISITCSKGSRPQVGIGVSGGTNPCASGTCTTSGTSSMSDGVSTDPKLNYSFSINVNSASSTTLGISNPETWDLNGTIGKAQDVNNGSYSDTLVAYVLF